MTAIDDLVTQLKQYRVGENTQTIVCDVDLLVAAFQQLATSVSTPAGSTGPGPTPQGRLTFTSGKPVIQPADYSNGFTTVFYTPYIGSIVPLFDGTNWNQTPFAETSQTLADNTKSPAAGAINSNYDYFVWSDAGTIRCTRGPAWSTQSARGAGAGTTELVLQNGLQVNKFNIANGPAALRGTYVGSLSLGPLIFASPTAVWIPNSQGAGGGANRLDLWNKFNRVKVTAQNIDTTTQYNYSLAAFRLKNGNVANEIHFMVGLIEDSFEASNYACASCSAASTNPQIGIWLNTSAGTPPDCISFSVNSAERTSGFITFAGQPALGDNFLAPAEAATVASVTTWYTQTSSQFTMLTASFMM